MYVLLNNLIDHLKRQISSEKSRSSIIESLLVRAILSQQHNLYDSRIVILVHFYENAIQIST